MTPAHNGPRHCSQNTARVAHQRVSTRELECMQKSPARSPQHTGQHKAQLLDTHEGLCVPCQPASRQNDSNHDEHDREQHSNDHNDSHWAVRGAALGRIAAAVLRPDGRVGRVGSLAQTRRGWNQPHHFERRLKHSRCLGDGACDILAIDVDRDAKVLVRLQPSPHQGPQNSARLPCHVKF